MGVIKAFSTPHTCDNKKEDEGDRRNHDNGGKAGRAGNVVVVGVWGEGDFLYRIRWLTHHNGLSL